MILSSQSLKIFFKTSYTNSTGQRDEADQRQIHFQPRLRPGEDPQVLPGGRGSVQVGESHGDIRSRRQGRRAQEGQAGRSGREAASQHHPAEHEASRAEGGSGQTAGTARQFQGRHRQEGTTRLPSLFSFYPLWLISS